MRNKVFDYNDYRTIESVKMPYSIIEKDIYRNDENYNRFYDIEQIKLNAQMDDKIFMKPKQ